MIVADLGDRYRFVTQPDHAALAGQFADRWGGAAARPVPFNSLVVAAYLHDAGWTDYDRRPRLDDDGEPVHGSAGIPRKSTGSPSSSRRGRRSQSVQPASWR